MIRPDRNLETKVNQVESIFLLAGSERTAPQWLTCFSLSGDVRLVFPPRTKRQDGIGRANNKRKTVPREIRQRWRCRCGARPRRRINQAAAAARSLSLIGNE